MPRVLSAAACLTCRRRKVKCDEQGPTCLRCSRADLYCERAVEAAVHRHRLPEKSGEYLNDDDAPLGPQLALQTAGVARLYEHYIKILAPWYDLSDGERHFARHVPREALGHPLLFAAIVAFAAVHLSKTGVATARTTAEQYHGQCVRILIGLAEREIATGNANTLAAICLLRSYEILAEDVDPSRHLSGAYALAGSQPIDLGRPSLLRAGFFNYLREDITYGLINRCALKLDLNNINASSYGVATDEDQLNVVTLVLADIINYAFGKSARTSLLHDLSEKLVNWRQSLPGHFGPLCENATLSIFPNIWMLGGNYVATEQYHLVASSIIESLTNSDINVLEDNAARVCGLAITSATDSVLVNSFGPISFSRDILAGL
ncbi:hypothetical protein LTR86_001877 [Recurvomyces mirabilis]|nr:hypothetical protein LTR86_001877 [Recurvomyces mirabilis]